METHLALSQMVKDGTIVRSNNSSPRYVCVPKRHENICPHKTCTIIFIATLFISAVKLKQTKCLSTDKWVNKMWYIYTTEWYLAIKRKDWHML